MLGDLLGSPTIKGLGSAIHVSPAPKVFTAHDGFETFSARFYLHWQDTAGVAHKLELTPETYQAIRGPYNRRNVYGAAFSYSPILSRNPLTRSMFAEVVDYAFCDSAPLLMELGVDPFTVVYPIEVQLEPRDEDSKATEWQLNYQINCLNPKEKSNA
jgi:hypothetical protein